MLMWTLTTTAVYSPLKTMKSGKQSVLGLFKPLAMMPAKQPAGNLDQVRNGSAASPLSPVDWVNGNAGASNSHYKEGQSILYRLVLTNMPLGPSSVKIEWDIKHSGKNAIDYITSPVRQPPGGISETIHICGDASRNTLIAGCAEGTFNTFLIPQPPVSQLVSGVPQPTTSFANLPANDKLMRIHNGNITGITYINNADGNLGDLTAQQSSTRASISFNATSSTVVLSWGGHIGSRGDWGFTNGVPNSAGGISGSPYHTRFIELCADGEACGGGNQDRSLSAAAVAPPTQCNLSGPDTVCEDTENTYTVDAGSLDTSATYSFALSNNTAGASITDQNGNPLSPPVFAKVTTTQSGSYTITATASNAGGSAPGCPVTVTVNANVTATDPTAQTVCEGGSATFSTTAGGTGPFTYQWNKGGNPIQGATSSSLTINPVSVSDAGTYSVTVTGACGNTTTQGALLTVNTATITSDPSDATRCEGGAVTFSTTASGTGPFTYQWKKGNDVIQGATSSSLTIDPIATTDAGTYTVTTTGACGSDSKSATLTVNNTVDATDPVAKTACIGSSVTFSTTASGTGPFTYQWFKGGNPINGATNSSYTIDPVALSDAGSYTVEVTGACGSKTTGAAILTVNNPSVDISLHNACDGSVFLQADTTGSGTFTFQWKYNGQNIQGATNATYVPTVPGAYTVAVADGNSCPASATKNLCFTFQEQQAGTTAAPANPNVAAQKQTLPSGLFFSVVRLILGIITLV